MTHAADSDETGDAAGRSDERRLDRVAQLVDDFPEPAFAIDRDGRFTRLNDHLCALLGLDRADIMGRVAYEVFGTEGESQTLADEVVDRGTAIREDDLRSATNADGETFHARAKALPIRDDAGRVVGALEVIAMEDELVENRQRIEAANEQMSGEVEAVVDDLRESADAVQDATTEIGDRADVQVETLDLVNDDMASFSATVEEIAATASTVASRGESARELATESRRTGEAANDRLDTVRASFETVTANVAALEETVASIDEMVDVIMTLSRQTGILALNANIEAARTDTDGDGFALVADEIKTLSKQSRSEGEEIAALVSDVREKMQEVRESIDETTRSFDEASALIDDAVENQDRIADRIDETADGLDEIAAATDDQASSAEAISGRLEDVVAMAADISSAVTDIAEANEAELEQVAAIEDSLARLEARMTAG